MQTMHDIRSEDLRLMNLFDQLPEGWDSNFHAAYDDLEREFAELRMQFGKH
jgi:hypothetical protein